MRRLRALLAPLALAAAVVLAGCSEGDRVDPATVAPAATSKVTAKDNRFTPSAVEVPAGTTVTWSFEDRFVAHDVTGDGWTSGKPWRKGTFGRAFDQPGTYLYRCTLHDGMDGRVVVTPA